MSVEQEQEVKIIEQKPAMSFKQKTTITVSVLMLVGLVAFVIQNYNHVKIEFFMFEFRVRIIYLMVFSAIIGMFTMYAFQKYRRSKKKK